MTFRKIFNRTQQQPGNQERGPDSCFVQIETLRMQGRFTALLVGGGNLPRHTTSCQRIIKLLSEPHASELAYVTSEYVLCTQVRTVVRIRSGTFAYSCLPFLANESTDSAHQLARKGELKEERRERERACRASESVEEREACLRRHLELDQAAARHDQRQQQLSEREG